MSALTRDGDRPPVVFRPDRRNARERRQVRLQSAMGQMLSDLNALFREYLGRRRRGGEVGAKTRRERRVVLERALRDLHREGLELRRLKNLGAKHIRAILHQWVVRELLPSTRSSYVSHLRSFCVWLGKPQLVDLIDAYVAEHPELVQRRTVADSDRSERGAGTDFAQILPIALGLDERFACQLTLIAAFGLRSLEAWLLRPHLVEGPHGEVRILWGTKGGRPRVLPMPITPEQQEVLRWAQSFAQTQAESMIPRGWTVQRWRRRYYGLCERAGLTRKGLGVTPHSLRFGVLLDMYKQLTRHAAPARGGSLVNTDPWADQAARKLIAEHAGHADRHVSSAYLGPVRVGPEAPLLPATAEPQVHVPPGPGGPGG